MKKAFFVLLAFLPVAVFFLCFWFQTTTDEKDAHFATMWGQFIVGNWPNWEGIIDRKSWLFSLAVALKFLLAYGLFYGVGALWWNLVKVREVLAMNLRQLLTDRDLTIEAQFLNTLPSNATESEREAKRDEVRSVLKRAAELWERKYLPILAGSAESARNTLDANIRS